MTEDTVWRWDVFSDKLVQFKKKKKNFSWSANMNVWRMKVITILNREEIVLKRNE